MIQAAKRLGACLACACLLTACAKFPEGNSEPDRSGVGGHHDLRPGSEPAASPGEALDAVDRGFHDADDEDIPEFRRRALLEAARERGSRMGYARRAWEIGGLLERRSSQLDRAYDFSRVVAPAPAGAGYVIPPVVSSGLDAFEGDRQGREASVVDEHLTIAAPGEIRPVRPTWRDYLLFERTPPDDPSRAPLPRSKAERTRFAEWFGEGWRAGTGLANSEISSRLGRLLRDYEGMRRYRHLVSRGMMNRMVLRDDDFGVTGGGGEMRVGDRTVRIVSDAAFRADPRRWSVRALVERDLPTSMAVPEDSRPRKPRNSSEADDLDFPLEIMPVDPSSGAAFPPDTDAGIPPEADAGFPQAAERVAIPSVGFQVAREFDAPVRSESVEAVPDGLRMSGRPEFLAEGMSRSLATEMLAHAGLDEASDQMSDSSAIAAEGFQVSLAPHAAILSDLDAASAQAADRPAFPSGSAEVSQAMDEPESYGFGSMIGHADDRHATSPGSKHATLSSIASLSNAIGTSSVLAARHSASRKELSPGPVYGSGS